MEMRSMLTSSLSSLDSFSYIVSNRFVREKADYKGPWIVPKRRAKKHPLAPKRPMSAFLRYSQMRRKQVKEENPDMSNTDVSRLLGEMWRNASKRERAPFCEQEERERAIYKRDIARFRAEQARLDAASRTSHHNVQQMGDYPMQPREEDRQARAEEAPDGNHLTQRSFEEYRTDQIAPVNSNDSHSLHEYRVPHYDPYAISHYSSRNHPPVGTGKHDTERLRCHPFTPSNKLTFLLLCIPQ